MKAVSGQQSAQKKELRFASGGPKSKLIFIHGWATNSWVWRRQVEEFSEEYDVTTVDLPGHSGKDTWDEPTLKPAVQKILEIVNRIGIGWSLGGQVLLEAALNYPDLFKGIILVASSPCFVEKKDFPYGQPQGVVKRMLKDIKKDFSKAMERFYPLNFTGDELANNDAKRFLEYYKKTSETFHHPSIVKSLEALMAFDICENLKHIKTPALIIQVSEDSVCPASASAYLAKNLGNAKIETLRGAGHIPFLTRSEEFNKIVRGFIKAL